MANDVSMRIACALLMMAVFAPLASAQETRLKDLVNIRGVRDNQLIGFGLVVGLRGTGDSNKSLATNQAAASMLTRLGLKTNATDVVAGNLAAVVVTAELPAFARIGDRLDVKVSAVGDARSLSGGTLLMTPLRAGNSQIYAVAQGAVVVGQADDKGPRVTTVGRVPQGAAVEKEFLPQIAPNNTLTLSLRQPDFTTAARVTEAINKAFKGFYAKAVDVSSIEVTVPPLYQNQLVEFVAKLEVLSVEADGKARVVLNERTGTVVMGSHVVIKPVTIAHGDLSIQVDDDGGKKKKDGKQVVNVGGSTVGELIETLNALGVKPADLTAILQSIHAAGALDAELRFL